MEELEWMSADPKKNNGIYMPEGTTVEMKNEKTGKIWKDFRYSSLPKPYQLAPEWITHWRFI
jgi:hypothetical protein